MYRPSQTPRMTLSSERVADGFVKKCDEVRGPRRDRPLGYTTLTPAAGASARLPPHRMSEGSAKVVVFQGRLAAPTYATPLGCLHKAILESSSTGSSFPAVSSPVQARSLGCGFAR